MSAGQRPHGGMSSYAESGRAQRTLSELKPTVVGGNASPRKLAFSFGSLQRSSLRRAEHPDLLSPTGASRGDQDAVALHADAPLLRRPAPNPSGASCPRKPPASAMRRPRHSPRTTSRSLDESCVGGTSPPTADPELTYAFNHEAPLATRWPTVVGLLGFSRSLLGFSRGLTGCCYYSPETQSSPSTELAQRCRGPTKGASWSEKQQSCFATPALFFATVRWATALRAANSEATSLSGVDLDDVEGILKC